jgi:hypothetical protein
MEFNARGLAETPAIEPLEAFVVLLTAADQLAPLLIWLLLAASSLPLLTPGAFGDGSGR